MRRDRELVEWVGRLGAVEARQVGVKFSVERSAAYELIARLIKAGLLERVQMIYGEPSLIRATQTGIAFAGLGLPLATIRIGELHHWIACADVVLWAERRYGNDAVLSEREIRFQEKLERRAVASAKLGELPDGRPRLHRPDLVVDRGDGLVAIEVELTPKAPARLRAIVRAWRRAACVERVVYFCSPGPTQQAVERAVAGTHSAERVSVLEIGGAA